jgi:hypothetical protein
MASESSAESKAKKINAKLKSEYAHLYLLAKSVVDSWEDPLTAKLDLEKHMVELRNYIRN